MNLLAYLAYLKGESCWWTIHPASKQRSEGEKVRFNDDVILVSVFSERYLVRRFSFACMQSKYGLFYFSMLICQQMIVVELMHHFVNKFGVLYQYQVVSLESKIQVR